MKQSKGRRRALTNVTDLVLADASIEKIEQAQRQAEQSGTNEDEYSQAVWNARRLLQGMTP